MLGLKHSSSSFQRLVKGLKDHGKTLTVVESCCGGLINASIMSVPGSSAVFFGGSVAYNTKKAKKLLLNDDGLHKRLVTPLTKALETPNDPAEAYIQSKVHWTEQTALAFCEQMGVDYAIAEGGASGPTFRPENLETGFAVIAVAGKDPGTGKARLLAQSTVRSTHADRQENMRMFADAAADLAADTIGIPRPEEESNRNNSPTSQRLDRATHLRTDEKALRELEESPDAKYVILLNSQECLFRSETELALLSQNSYDDWSFAGPKTFLGLDSTTQSPIFAIDLNDDTKELFNLPEGTFFDNTRTHAPLMQAFDYELVLYATALSNWKRTHKFCSIDGEPLVAIHGGTCLQCTSCGTMSWPRQDPSIIVLVTNRAGDKVLLARSPRHPPRVHTALAGFVEAGEMFETAVVREVFEETGVHVDLDSITYNSSQPWPFPRSCMIGFHATADDTMPLSVDTDELVSAGWFDREQVMAATQVPGAIMNATVAEAALQENPSLEVLIPPKGVLARSLIDAWLFPSR